MKAKWVIALTTALCILGLTMVIACGDDDDDDNNDDGNVGSILGMVRNFITGDAVEGASIKAMLTAQGWSEDESDEHGVFQLGNAPAGSRIFVEFEKSGWCPMSSWVITGDVDHSGQITDMIIDAIPADSTWTITVRDELGDPASGIEVSMTPTSYEATPVTDNTNAMGDAAFKVGLFQSYRALIVNEEIHGDEYYSASAQTTVDSSSMTSTIYLLPVADQDDDAWGDDDAWDDDGWDDDAWG